MRKRNILIIATAMMMSVAVTGCTATMPTANTEVKSEVETISEATLEGRTEAKEPTTVGTSEVTTTAKVTETVTKGTEVTTTAATTKPTEAKPTESTTKPTATTGKGGHWETKVVTDKAAWDEEVPDGTETVCVKQAWDEEVPDGSITVCVKEAWDEQVCVQEAYDDFEVVGSHSVQTSSGSWSEILDYDIIHHDAVYETVHHEAEYKEIPQYRLVHHEAEYKEIPRYRTVHHEAETHTEKVWVED